MKDLTPRQRKFIKEYLIDFNATQAAIRAGYSERSAYQIGHALLKRVEVRDAIERALGKREAKTEVTADYLVEAGKEVLERSLERKPVMIREGREVVQAEEKLTCPHCQDPECEGNRSVGLWQFDSLGANGALKFLGGHVRGFNAPKQQEVTGKDGTPLIPNALVVPSFADWTVAERESLRQWLLKAA